MPSAEDFLKKKYKLHTAPEVEGAAMRTDKRTGEEIVRTDASALIRNYLDRFQEILGRTDTKKRQRGVDALKEILHDKYVIRIEEIPDSYWEGLRRIARERGQGADLEQIDWNQLKSQTAEGLIADQHASLDAWVDYLSSGDATYPDWLKYFAFRSILGIGEYDKEKKEFSRRSKGTVKPFPDINREALALVLDAVEKRVGGKKIEGTHVDSEEFQKLLEQENFAKLYAFAIDKCTPASEEALSDTRGVWKTYPQNSGHASLVQSIQGHGTGWCTAGESTAEAQLASGDMHVFYSLDKAGKPTVPRAAIRMENGKIAEVRGVAEQQNLDRHIAPVVQQKLQEFSDGKIYEKKVGDMKHLTDLERKMTSETPLTKEDLQFLYEIDTSIEGFGYRKDPRIMELRSRRNVGEDMPIVFDCSKEQIARKRSDITPDTKAFVGSLTDGFFTDFPSSLRHIYTSFPEGRIRLEDLDIGGMTAEEYQPTLEKKGFRISDYAKSMLQNKGQFITPVNEAHRKRSGETETIGTVLISVKDLGFSSDATTKDIFAKARVLGLELCPPETGPSKRLQGTNQPMGDNYWIGMEPVTASDGRPHVFALASGGGGRWLGDRWAGPDDLWVPDDRVLFRLRKSDTQNLGTASDTSTLWSFVQKFSGIFRPAQ